MFGKKDGKPQTRIDSLIGSGTRVDGNVTFSGGLRIDGEVKGNVMGAAADSATLVISEQATVEGEVRVAHVVINGTVKGPIYSSESIELQPNSRVTGDVFYKALEMHVGASIDGRLVHGGEGLTEVRPVELKVASWN